jgi:hypothetical protein
MASNADPDTRTWLGWEDVVRFLDSPSNFLWLIGALVAIWALALAVSDAAAVNDAFTGLAFLVGGFWVLYQFVLRRSFESALEIEVDVTTSPDAVADRFVVFVDVRIKNIGNRRLTALPNLTGEKIEDFEHSVEHPGDLQIARIETGSGEAFAGWYKGLTTGALTLLPELPAHIHLLYEYTRADKRTDFFMEPGEACGLGNALMLPKGNYVAKAVFVGSRTEASEFWSRVVYFSVPQRGA